jgi:hypothetical protein
MSEDTFFSVHFREEGPGPWTKNSFHEDLHEAEAEQERLATLGLETKIDEHDKVTGERLDTVAFLSPLALPPEKEEK